MLNEVNALIEGNLHVTQISDLLDNEDTTAETMTCDEHAICVESRPMCLHAAIAAGHIKLVLAYIKNHLHEPHYLVTLNEVGKTPLHQAIVSNQSEIAVTLIHALADAMPEALVCHNRCGSTPLHMAVIREQAEIAEALIVTLKRIHPSGLWESNAEGHSPLELAIAGGRKEIAMLLVVALAEINPMQLASRNSDGMTPIELAIVNHSYKIAMALLTIPEVRLKGIVVDEFIERSLLSKQIRQRCYAALLQRWLVARAAEDQRLLTEYLVAAYAPDLFLEATQELAKNHPQAAEAVTERIYDLQAEIRTIISREQRHAHWFRTVLMVVSGLLPPLLFVTIPWWRRHVRAV